MSAVIDTFREKRLYWTHDAAMASLSWHEHQEGPIHRFNAMGVFLIFIAFMLRYGPEYDVYILNFLHEWCHVAAVVITGGTIVSVSTQEVIFSGGDFTFITASGFFGEVLAWGMTALLFRKYHGGHFALGALSSTGIIALNSVDFEQIYHIYNTQFVVFWIIALILCWTVYAKHGIIRPPLPPNHLIKMVRDHSRGI